jgi:hypothetical protein
MADDAPPAYEVVPGVLYVNQWQTRDVFSRYYVLVHGTCISNDAEARDRWESKQTVLFVTSCKWALWYAEQHSKYRKGDPNPLEHEVCYQIAVATSLQEQYRAIKRLVDRQKEHEECVSSFYEKGIGGIIEIEPVEVVAETESKTDAVPLMRIMPDDFCSLGVGMQLYVLARGVPRTEMRVQWHAKQTEVVDVIQQSMKEALESRTHGMAYEIALEMSRTTNMEELYALYWKLLARYMCDPDCRGIIYRIYSKLEVSRVVQTLPTTVVVYITKYKADRSTLYTQMWEYWDGGYLDTPTTT